MKRFFLMLFIFTLWGAIGHAQRAYNEGIYIVVDAVGLPEAAVKTKSEVLNGTLDENGRVYRHQVTEGHGGNPNVNAKVSPRFALAPEDVPCSYIDSNSGPVVNAMRVNWMVASGWEDESGDFNTNPSADLQDTGCYAYRGPDGNDTPGTWRLPTQREFMLIWILRDKLYSLNGMIPFTSHQYWTSTEAEIRAGWASAYYMTFNANDIMYPGPKKDNLTNNYVRCIKDLVD